MDKEPCSIIEDDCPYTITCGNCSLKWWYDHTKELAEEQRNAIKAEGGE